jgi:hypothetical protein
MPTPSAPSAIWGMILAGGSSVFAVDPPIVQDANFRANQTYFSYVDSQVRGLQTHVVQSLVSGLNATWATLDASSAAVSAGDVVCLAGFTSGTVTKGTSGALAAAGMAFGIALQAAAPGGQLPIAVKGKVPASITGLPTSGNQLYARAVSNRVSTVASLGVSDFVLGTVDAAGNLTLSIQLPAATTGSALAPGTAGQILFTNTTPATAWTTPTQDISSSTSTIGQLTVVGLRGLPLPTPSVANTFLTWTGSALGWVSVGGGGSITWANDLAGNGTTSSTNQYVSSLSFSSSASGGSISVNGTNTLLNWITNAITLQQSGTTLLQLKAATTDFVAFGATPGTSGFLRANSNATIVGVNGSQVLGTDSSPNTILQAPTGQSISFRVGSGVEVLNVNGSVLSIEVPTAQWTSGITSPTLTHASTGSVTQGQSMAITPQQSTQATNFGGGNLNVSLQTPGGSGTTSYLQVVEGSTVYGAMGRLFGSTSTYGTVYLGQGIVPSASNYCLASDGAVQTQLNAPSQLLLIASSATQVNIVSASVTLTPATLQWSNGVSSPTLMQASTSSTTTGQNLKIQPQQSTQATNFASGNVNVTLQTPGGSGKTAYLQTVEGSTVYSAIGRLFGSSATYGCVYLGQGITPSASNYCLACDGSSQTQLVAPTSILFVAGGAGQVSLSSSTMNVYSGGYIFNPWQGSTNGQNKNISQIPYTAQTPGASAATIYTFATTTNTTVTLYATGTVASRGSCANVATFQNSSGTVSQLGSTSLVWQHGVANPSISFSISGTNVLVQGNSGISSAENWEGYIIATVN